MSVMQTKKTEANRTREREREVRIGHEPLLLFLSLWHCLDVHIYWDFCLGQATTEPHRGEERRREGEREGEEMMIDNKRGGGEGEKT